jgi:O-acetyl-ADP-ribose deacetylase (regulator of RNase III)
MPFEMIHGDITSMKTDAIVNAANSMLQMGGGVCGAIFRAAGAIELQKACNEIGRCETGQAVITKGFQLPAQYIIHTVGPIWCGGTNAEEDRLSACYRNSLQLAKKHHLTSIAFPLISSGIYAYPKEAALQVAIDSIQSFLKSNDQMVFLVLYE